MKNKRIRIAIGVIVLVLVLIAIASLISTKNADKKKPIVYFGTKKSACEIFSPIDATEVFKASATPVSSKNIKNTSSNNVKVTSCAFNPTSGVSNVDASTLASLVVITPISKDGVSDNNEAFANPPSGTEKVSGYGDSAYWDPSTGTLNILAHKTWYVFTYGSSNSENRILDQTKKLADYQKADL